MLWMQMKDNFASDFETILKKMKWPGKNVTLAGSLEQEWTEGVERLLKLQQPYAYRSPLPTCVCSRSRVLGIAVANPFQGFDLNELT